MKTNFEEIMYKTWLKSEIIKQNKIFKFKKDNREINVQILINHIFNTNSKIAEKMREKTIDINGDVSRDELMNFLSHTNKGDIIRWENSEGQKMYFLNRGKKLNGNDFENYIESLKEKASCHKSFIKTFPSRGQLYSKSRFKFSENLEGWYFKTGGIEAEFLAKLALFGNVGARFSKGKSTLFLKNVIIGFLMVL